MQTRQERELWENTKVGEWLDVEFEDEETGEAFLVELKKEEGEDIEDFIVKCQEIADENFSDAHYLELISSEEAEILGYDTY